MERKQLQQSATGKPDSAFKACQRLKRERGGNKLEGKFRSKR